MVEVQSIKARSRLPELADLLKEAFEDKNNMEHIIKCVAEGRMVCAGPLVLRLESPRELEEWLCLSATPRDGDSFVFGYSLDMKIFFILPL